MNEAAILKKLCELNETITMVPRAAQGKATSPQVEGVYLPHFAARSASVEDSLDQLRLQVKYLLFDLEATRRENRYLRQMLENRPRPDRDEGDPEKP